MTGNESSDVANLRQLRSLSVALKRAARLFDDSIVYSTQGLHERASDRVSAAHDVMAHAVTLASAVRPPNGP